MSTAITNGQPPVAAVRKGRSAGRPSQRNCRVYERAMLDGESYEAIAADYAISRQRIARIVAQVEGWIACHPAHELAQKMRVRCGKRWQTLWEEAMTCFTRSREDRQIKKDCTRRAAAGEVLSTVTELTTRQQNGDPRFLSLARRVADRDDRLWMREQTSSVAAPAVDAAQYSPRGRSVADTPGKRARLSCEARYAYLPAALSDLEQLACGLSPGGSTPVSTLFERRCAEAFRSLGFEVRELGQGCGRVADCLAVAAVERFAVVIDAKVRRRGYSLGTDDRQFCEYATRHSRELALSGIERVYFAVVGRGFRQDDLDKLAKFMAGTPIRSVVFIEAEALMRLVNDSIAKRREFRLADVDKLLFGNKIVE